MASNLGPHTRLGPQTSHRRHAGQDTAPAPLLDHLLLPLQVRPGAPPLLLLLLGLRRKIRQQGAILVEQDMDGQIRVGSRELVVQLLGKAEVDGVPQFAAGGGDPRGVRGRDGPAGRAPERGGDGRRQCGGEGVQHVDGARHAVEADGFETHFAD